MVRRVLIVAIVYSVVLAVSAQAAHSDLPKTMQAVAMDHTGGPDVLQLRTLPVPGVGADEVLIATLTASVGVWDSGIRTKLNYINQPRFPFVMGSDGAGTIAAVGSAVTTMSTLSGFFGTAMSQLIGSHLPEASWVLLATSHSALSGAVAAAIRRFT